MEFPECPAPATVLLKACCMLLFLSYASSARGLLLECPLIAPLSSYSPSIPSVSSSPVTPQVAATLESKISSLIANNSVPFYAVSVVYEDQTVFTSGLATSPFMIGSVTKTFTALGALILRERGLLSLDDPVKKFLPEFKIANPYEPHDTTLRELMGHLAGLPRDLCNGGFSMYQSETTCPIEEADVLESVAQMQLVRPPWSREPSYSNLGFALLGHSWEKATSPPKSWNRFLVEDILKPLGMNNTGANLTNVTLVMNESAAHLDSGWAAPAGNMYSTATDLAKYLIFLLRAKPALISAATIREWTHPTTTFPDGNGGFALPWELVKINSTGTEFLITKSGTVVMITLDEAIAPQGNGEIYQCVIAIHPPTQLGVSVLFARNDSSWSFRPHAIMEAVLDYLIPLVEKETAGIIAPFYSGHYVCKATPPIHSQPLNLTVEVLGGFIDIADSPSLGLSASINVSLLFNGRPTQQILTAGMLLKNSSQNSFWLGVGVDCLNIFASISEGPSTTDPNNPGTDYLHEIEFDFGNKVVLWPAMGAVCLKEVVLVPVSEDITWKTSFSA